MFPKGATALRLVGAKPAIPEDENEDDEEDDLTGLTPAAQAGSEPAKFSRNAPVL